MWFCEWPSGNRAGAWRPPPKVDLSLSDYPGLDVMLKKIMTDFNLMTMWWEVRQCHCDVERWMEVAKNAGGCQHVVATLYQAQDILDDLEVELRWLDGLLQPDAELAWHFWGCPACLIVFWTMFDCQSSLSDNECTMSDCGCWSHLSDSESGTTMSGCGCWCFGRGESLAVLGIWGVPLRAAEKRDIFIGTCCEL